MIDVYYHMYCFGDCLERFQNTLNKIKRTGLYDSINSINLNLTGDSSKELFTAFPIQDSKIILTNHYTDSSGEMDTLKLLWDDCKQKNSKILYLHSKGVSRPGNQNVQAWIEYMEYFVIEKWKDCLNALDSHDTCGVNLQPKPMKHYSGNFWWANSSYIQKLSRFNPELSSYIKVPRVYCEFWLLDNSFCKTSCLFSSNVDHYSVHYGETNYKTN